MDGDPGEVRQNPASIDRVLPPARSQVIQGLPPQHHHINPKAPIVGYGCLTIDMDAASFSPAGYNADFLEIPLPLPALPAGTPIRELPYTHFTVLLDPARRLAIATGVNIDGDQLVDVDRGADWHLDSRIPIREQTGEAGGNGIEVGSASV